jgi:hypothetical protein
MFLKVIITDIVFMILGNLVHDFDGASAIWGLVAGMAVITTSSSVVIKKDKKEEENNGKEFHN